MIHTKEGGNNMIKQILFDCAGVLAQMKFKDTMLKISGSEEIAEYLSLDLSVADIAQNLVDKANDKGGTDNITAMVIKISPELPEPQSVDELEKQESNLLLEIAEKRVDYGTK